MAEWMDALGDLELLRDADAENNAMMNAMAERTEKPAKLAGNFVVPAAPEELQGVSVRHSEILRWNTCALCDAPTEPGWRTCKSVKPLCPRCERQFPVQAAWAEELNRTCPAPTWHQARFGLVLAATVQNTVCPGCYESTDPKTWQQAEVRGEHGEVGSVSEYAGGERFFCEDCLRGRFAEHTAAQRAVLERFYDRERALRPVPAPPPPPSAEEVAERDRQRREQQALLLATQALFRREAVTNGEAEWAKRLFQSIEVWLGSRPKETA